MSHFLHDLHTDLRGSRISGRGKSNTSEARVLGQHKTYQRMERIALPNPLPLNCSLDTALATRESVSQCPQQLPLSVDTMGTLLGHALRRREGKINRNYPSGGALYPIETYVLTTKFEGAKPGVFHYNPSEHALVRLWDIPPLELSEVANGGRENFDFSTLILFTSVWKRSSAKYGNFAYNLALMEAGHMSENILLVSTALALKSRPLAGFNDQRIANLLDLTDEEQPILGIALIKPSLNSIKRKEELIEE